MIDPQSGLGTKLRLLLSMLDGELTELYKQEQSSFRPRFFPVFQLLLQSKRASIGEIGAFLHTSQPAATQTVAEMKKLGLVADEAGTDKRRRLVRLTPLGRETADALQPIWKAVGGAAAELDEQLSHPLSSILDEAITALEGESFRARIARHRVKGRSTLCD